MDKELIAQEIVGKILGADATVSGERRTQLVVDILNKYIKDEGEMPDLDMGTQIIEE